jgi:hypothetical protein
VVRRRVARTSERTSARPSDAGREREVAALDELRGEGSTAAASLFFSSSLACRLREGRARRDAGNAVHVLDAVRERARARLTFDAPAKNGCRSTMSSASVSGGGPGARLAEQAGERLLAGDAQVCQMR